ncbi:MAG: hypothetical protein ACI87W_001126 [Halieaceae bacterium]|jgi:hypothetical protein
MKEFATNNLEILAFCEIPIEMGRASIDVRKRVKVRPALRQWLFGSGVAAVLLLQAVPGAWAQDDPRFSVSVGAFFTDRDSKTRLDGTAGEGSDVDLEGDLGIDGSDTVLRLDGYWRFAEKHRIDFSVFDLSRTASTQIDKEFTWKDTTYSIDTQLDTSLDLSIYKASYSWLFMKRDWGFVAATAGLYVADMGVSISVPETNSSEGGGVTAPLPVVGLRGEYNLNDRWSLRGSAEIFAVEYGDYSGSLSDIFAGIDFSATEHVALGLGFNAVQLDVGVEKSNFNGDFDWSYSGAMAYLKFDF